MTRCVPEILKESEEVTLHSCSSSEQRLYQIMMVAKLPTERLALQILSSLYTAKYSNLSSRRMSDGLFPYGPAPQENGTTDSSKKSHNAAATIAIASILPMLIIIFLLVMIVMSVGDVFLTLSLLT